MKGEPNSPSVEDRPWLEEQPANDGHDVVDIHFAVPERSGKPTEMHRKMGRASPLPPLVIPDVDGYDDSVLPPPPPSEPDDGLEPARSTRSYTDDPSPQSPRRRQLQQPPSPRAVYQRSSSEYEEPCVCRHVEADPEDWRRSWALAPSSAGSPTRVSRHSYCGVPPSPKDLVLRSPRSASPSIYLLTPDRAHSPFRPDDDVALGRSVESLDSIGVPSRRISTITVTDGSNGVLQIPTDSGQPMVLQLVLPRNSSTPESGQGSLSPSTPHETQSSNQDTYDGVGKLDVLPAGSNACTVSTASSMTTLMKPDGHTTYPQLTNTEQAVVPVNGEAKLRSPLPPPTTSDRERKEIFKKNLTTMLSSIYAIFIVMLGGVVYVADILQPMKAYGEVFTIYLTIVGLAWLGFLHFDIRLYLNSLALWKKEDKRRYLGRDNEAYDKTFDGISGKPDPLPNVSDPTKPPPESYCFKTGRHSGSFYLKIGAAVFCFGHLIHEGLLLSRQIAYFTSEQKYLQQCADVIALILSILHPLFSFYQLFMVFKYSSIVINRYKEVARFAIMHIIAANLCLWVNTIIRETEEALAHHPQGSTSSNVTDYHNDTSDDEHGVQDTCISRTILSEFTIQAAPYLYPFTIEYSLLQVGIWLIIWCNIGDTEAGDDEKHRHSTHSYGEDGRGEANAGESFSSNLVIHVDCHSANRGLFAGLFILLATVVSVIIFFVAMTNQEYIKTGIVINNVSDTVLLLLMIFSVVFAYRQTARLDFNPHAGSLALDDFLLYIALPCFFLYTIFNVVGSVAVKNPFIIVISILTVIQVTIQTPFIIDGLRRCSNSYTLRYRKPGREIITFLIVCNVACWILETFEIKSYDAQADRIQYYGSFLWTLLSHITLPLTLFYRFHSSVCLVDMWKSAYEQGDAH